MTGHARLLDRGEFTSAILNPPYRKIHGESTTRQRLRTIGIETGNLYTAFLALADAFSRPAAS